MRGKTMSMDEKTKKFILDFVGQREDPKKKLDEHLEKAYRKKEDSLTNNIKAKTRAFKAILLENGFKEAEFYVENRLWKWKYYKQTAEDVAFIVNLEPYDDYIEIYYGYASTAFTKMVGCSDSLKEHGVDSDDITVRSMFKYTYGDSESLCCSTIKSFHYQYLNLSKDDLLQLAKERKKDFLCSINLKLKPLGFKKKDNAWSIYLNQQYYLSFCVEKARFCDCYRFEYVINSIENETPFIPCYMNHIGYEYKSQRYDYNWQCYSNVELNNFLKFIIEEILLPIINTDESSLKDLVVALNTIKKPQLFIPTDEDIKFWNIIHCDLEKCTNCFKK